MMSMKRTILIIEVKYSNHANTLLGMEKMTQVVTTNMVTAHTVSTSVPLRIFKRYRIVTTAVQLGINHWDFHTHGRQL